MLFGEEMVCVVLGSTANGAQGAARVGLHLRNELSVWACARVYKALENFTIFVTFTYQIIIRHQTSILLLFSCFIF